MYHANIFKTQNISTKHFVTTKRDFLIGTITMEGLYPLLPSHLIFANTRHKGGKKAVLNIYFLINFLFDEVHDG